MLGVAHAEGHHAGDDRGPGLLGGQGDGHLDRAGVFRLLCAGRLRSPGELEPILGELNAGLPVGLEGHGVLRVHVEAALGRDGEEGRGRLARGVGGVGDEGDGVLVGGRALRVGWRGRGGLRRRRRGRVLGAGGDREAESEDGQGLHGPRRYNVPGPCSSRSRSRC